MERYTADTLLGEDLVIRQPVDGYRFTIDPVILARSLNPLRGQHILDIGCGCGIMPLILGYQLSDIRITGVELQPALAHCARTNAEANHMDFIRIIEGDATSLFPQRERDRADHVISNPPYIRKGSGRINPDPQKAAARHEITMDIQSLCAVARRMMTAQGTFHLIFPADRLADLTLAMEQNRLFLQTLQFIHPRPHAHALRIVATASKKSTDKYQIKPALYLQTASGNPTRAYLNLFNA